MDNFNSESNDAFAFKIEPPFIPATAIQRSQSFPHYTGGFGDVWKCSMFTQSETRPVAVKVIKVPDTLPTAIIKKKYWQEVRREAYVWIQLLHDNILPLEGVTEGFGVLPAFVSPWMKNGTLHDYLKREVGLSWERKLSMVREVAAGLQYLHDKGIVHGDITETNILISNDGRLCLSDYGLSMIFAGSGNPTFNSCHGGNLLWM
ncbi:kinase-like protein, partial [Suillus weaverae]